MKGAELHGWNYTSLVTPQRRAKLLEHSDFLAVLRLAAKDVCKVTAWVEPGRDDNLKHCNQAVFSLQLPEWGDCLFNGSQGLRAQYWRSPEEGVAANAALITALMPTLLAAVDMTRVPRFATLDVSASLGALSAKFWVLEGQFLNDDQPALDVARWNEWALAGNKTAKLGRLAPDEGMFEVKGALLDPMGNEVVPASKVRRHYDIHRYGYS